MSIEGAPGDRSNSGSSQEQGEKGKRLEHGSAEWRAELARKLSIRTVSNKNWQGKSPEQEQVRPPMRYDSAERRQAIAQHLERLGISPELQAVRMLVELGNATPPSDAVRRRPGEGGQQGRSRGDDQGRGQEPPHLSK